MPTPESLPAQSTDLTADLLAALREQMPHVFSESGVDFDKLKATLGAHVETGKERYGLNWAGKADAFRNVQTLSTGTLFPQLSESVNWDSTENLIIEGDNLEVLKLLQRPYHGKVKMIYIDPPYNTGNEFIYPDNFREGLADYLRFSGQVNEEGFAQSANKDTSGRYHSNWLNMMYPRLFLARNLLRDDGVIFVSIDDHEVHNLRHLMDEVFGEENFVACIAWQHSIQPKGYSGKFSVHHNYHLMYRRSDGFSPVSLERTDEHNKSYANPDNDPRGPWRTGDVRNSLDRPNLKYDITTPDGNVLKPPTLGWRWSKETLNRKIQEGEIVFSTDQKRIIRKIYLSTVEGRTPETLWLGKEVGTTRDASSELKILFDGDPPFETPKPSSLLTRMAEVSGVEDDDVICDFFAGSGTTAQAVLELNEKDGGNRKFILVQLPEKTDNPKFPTIADITRERVRRVIARINSKNIEQSKIPQQSSIAPLNGTIGEKANSELTDLGFRAFKLTASNFRVWDSDAAKDETTLKEQIALHADNLLGPLGTDATTAAVLYELILRAGLPISAKVERVTTEHGDAFSVNGKALMICVAPTVTLPLMRALVALAPERLVCLDKSFDGNDALKTNALLEAESHGVKFQTA